MSWTIHPPGELDRLAEEWQALQHEHHRGHPLLDLKFVRPALDCFGGARVLLGREHDGSGVRALALLERRGAGRWQTFGPSQAPVSLLVMRPDYPAGGGLPELVRRLPGHALLLSILNHDAAYAALSGDGEGRLERLDHATTISIDLAGGFEAFWQSRKKKLRDNVGRYFRRLAAGGLSYRLSTLREAGALVEGLRAYGELESRGWKGRSGTAIHEQNLQGEFYGRILAAFAPAGGARVYQLHFGEALAASRLAIVQDGILVFLKTTYDEAAAQYAPGRLLLYLVLERLFSEREARVAEFYTQATPEQFDWCTDRRPILHLNVYRSAWLAGLHRLSRRVRGAA